MTTYFIECPKKGNAKDGEFERATGIFPDGTEDYLSALDEARGCAFFDSYPVYTKACVRLPKARIVDETGAVIKEFY